jgi:hypothetical protein
VQGRGIGSIRCRGRTVAVGVVNRVLLHWDSVNRLPSKVRKRMQSCRLLAVEFKEAGMWICCTHWIATLLWGFEVTLPAHNQLIA